MNHSIHLLTLLTTLSRQYISKSLNLLVHGSSGEVGVVFDGLEGVGVRALVLGHEGVLFGAGATVVHNNE